MEEHPVILKVITAPSIVYKCEMFLSALVLGIIYISFYFSKITVVVRTAATCSNSAHKLITLNLMALRTF